MSNNEVEYLRDLSLVVVLKEHKYFDGKSYPGIEQLVKCERCQGLVASNRERRYCIIDGHAKDIENSRILICRNV
jgi:hypothetical protein